MPQMSIEQYVDYGRLMNPGWYEQDQGASIRNFYPGYIAAYSEGESPGTQEYYAAGGLIGIGAGIGAGAIAEIPYSGTDPGALIQPAGNGSLDWTQKYRDQYPLPIGGNGGMNGTVPEYVDGFEVVGPWGELPGGGGGGGDPWGEFVASGGRIPGSEEFRVGYAPMVAGGSPFQMAKAAALSISVGRAGQAAISGAGIATFIGTWGLKMAKLIFGALAVKEVSDLLGLGLGEALESLMILWNPNKKEPVKRRRYSFSMNSRVGTVSRSAKALRKVLRRHDKAIRTFLPRPARYGIPPAQALSTIEKRAIRGRK